MPQFPHSCSRIALILLSGAVLLGPVPAADVPKEPAKLHSPLNPKEAQVAFRLAPGLRIELVAAEPQIESPVAMAFDEDGRLWVVEMQDYPNGPPPGKPPEGRIKILEDRDGDGYYAHSTVFADKLLFANGILPWRGGAFVTAAPHLLYLTPDGKREVVYEGFAAQNPQLRVSHPVLGLDGHVYAANGLRGGQVKRAGRADAGVVNLSGVDFRFDPLDLDHYEAISGMGQYGNTFDDWGRRFVCDNAHHLRHIVLEDRYIKRNPYLAVPAVLEDISELEPGPLSSGGKVFPISHNWTTSNLHAGHFTSACSIFIYRGDLLPAEYRGCAFTCEPAGNLVHQEVLRPKGATFQSRPARDGVEFLASPDDWFRPVFLADGPDGALYVVDMYRAVIEHPEFMPPELKKRPDLLLGKDKGRIWRIVPEGYHGRPPKPRLSKAKTEELVKLLEHRGAWWRTTAERLLLERRDPSAVESLRHVIESSKEPRARVHAAWLLHRLGGLRESLLCRLLLDRDAAVREQGLFLSEPRLAKSQALQELVLGMAEDRDARVRFQLALTLGEWDSDQILEPLAQIAVRGVEDSWTRRAVASSVANRAGDLILLLLTPHCGLTQQVKPARLRLLQELATLVGSRRDKEEVTKVLEALLRYRGQQATRWRLAAINGLADGMGRRGMQLGQFLGTLRQTTAKSWLSEQVATLLTEAGAVAADEQRDAAERLDAIRLLAHAPWETSDPVLTRLVREDPAQEIRLAGVRALAAHAQADVAARLMESWRSYTPAVRREVLEVMLQRPERVRFLLKEIEEGHVRPADLDPARVQQLVHYREPELRERARKLLERSMPEERKQVFERYRAAIAQKGDPERGKAVFQKNCSTCHRIAGIGTLVGPDISDLPRTKTAEQLLLDILNPNAAIDSNYINYVVTTKDGKVFTGIIAAETASSVTLRRAENQTDTILRQDIEEIQSTGQSLMPEGLEKTISIAEMADLMAFLKNWRYLDGMVPVGK
jgi:putative membrane-bound dehydrogenase-like protein